MSSARRSRAALDAIDLVRTLVASGGSVVEEVERPIGEELPLHLGFESPALMPGPEHVSCYGTGTTREDQKRAHQTVQHDLTFDRCASLL